MPCTFSTIKHSTPMMVFMLAALPIAGALVSQYGFNLHPCPLCIYQRIPYFVIMGLAVLMCMAGRNSSCTMKALLWLAVLAFLADAGIALFHVGVEYKWWEGLEGCSGSGGATSVDDLLAQLQAAPTARCDEPQFVFLLSMAGWNMLYALFAALVTVKLASKRYGESCDADVTPKDGGHHGCC